MSNRKILKPGIMNPQLIKCMNKNDLRTLELELLIGFGLYSIPILANLEVTAVTSTSILRFAFKQFLHICMHTSLKFLQNWALKIHFKVSFWRFIISRKKNEGGAHNHSSVIQTITMDYSSSSLLQLGRCNAILPPYLPLEWRGPWRRN